MCCLIMYPDIRLLHKISTTPKGWLVENGFGIKPADRVHACTKL